MSNMEVVSAKKEHFKFVEKMRLKRDVTLTEDILGEETKLWSRKKKYFWSVCVTGDGMMFWGEN